MVMYRATAQGNILLTDEEESRILSKRDALDSIDIWKEKVKSSLKAKRKEVAEGGITWQGSEISTDDKSISTLTGAYSFLNLNQEKVLNWKTGNGTFVKLNQAQIIVLVGIVANFIQECFDNEAAHIDIIDSSTKDELKNYDVSTGWPSKEK